MTLCQKCITHMSGQERMQSAWLARFALHECFDLINVTDQGNIQFSKKRRIWLAHKRTLYVICFAGCRSCNQLQIVRDV